MVKNLDAVAVNKNMDFVNLQLYSPNGPNLANDFIERGIVKSLLAYGAKFETDPKTRKGQQTADKAYKGYTEGGYKIITQWRLNSDNFAYEQKQQQELFRLVFSS